MTSPFDQPVDRQNSFSVKWDYHMTPDLRYRKNPPTTGDDAAKAIPMWIADMDFRCAEPIIEAMTRVAAHGVYGYSRAPDEYYRAIIDWFKRRQGITLQREWIVNTNGVVSALNIIIQAFVEPGQNVLLQGPVYYPFYSAIQHRNANVVCNSLELSAGRYTMDLDDLQRKLADPNTVLALLCNPHNPGGSVWQKEELQQLAALCLEHDVLLVSDEIHGDLTLPGNRFTPLLSLENDEIAKHSIVCTSPSKAFNIAGLHCSQIFVPDKKLRAKFEHQSRVHAAGNLSPFAIAATIAAYKDCDAWLDECIEYLQANIDFALEFIKTRCAPLSTINPESTYLLWIDCRELGLDSNALHALFARVAHVYLDDGIVFGQDGNGFVRMNVACTRHTLHRALERIERALKHHSSRS